VQVRGKNAVADNGFPLPEVSILMAVYNCATTVSSAIRSILNQTLENWELILVDDASTDGSCRAIEQFRDSRIKVIRNSTNLGLAASLNRAIAVASAPYFARMDADDICFSSRLEQQLLQLKAQPTIDVLGTGILLFKDSGIPLGISRAPIDHSAICSAKLIGTFSLYHPTWMGKADWFRRHLYDPVFSKAQDFELLLRAAPTSEYANLPDVLLGYRTDSVLNIRKRSQTRAFVLKALAKNVVSVRDYAGLLWILAITVFKTVADIVFLIGEACGIGRQHLRPLSPEDLKAWHHAWSRVHFIASVPKTAVKE
jgi:glycosyltransferase involved in cell wall biosynthesis